MIAVRPPEYFPRIGYLGLLLHVDHFVIADTFQYSRQSFQNRSKLRNPEGWQWVSIPLFGSPRDGAIQDVDIDTNARWQEKHWRSFMYNYRSTLYFEYYEETFRPFFDETWTHLGPASSRSVELMVEMLDLDVTLTRASELEGAPDTVEDVVRTLGMDDETLLVPPAAASVDAEAAPSVRVLDVDVPEYRQNFEGFEPGMSAMDLLFNYGPDARRLTADATTVRDLKETELGS